MIMIICIDLSFFHVNTKMKKRKELFALALIVREKFREICYNPLVSHTYKYFQIVICQYVIDITSALARYKARSTIS